MFLRLQEKEISVPSNDKPTALGGEKVPRGECRIKRSPADLQGALNHAKAETIRRGGEWEGNLESGVYLMQTPLGSISGTYTVAENSVNFAIFRKPKLVPCALIASVIDQFITA